MGKTVFVLGAGASKDIDPAFPTGGDLATSIQVQLDREMQDHGKTLGENGPIISAILRDGLGTTQWNALRRLRDGIVTKDSIDEFIDEYGDIPDLAKIGKLAITHQILEAERQSLFWSDAPGAQVLNRLRNKWLGRIIRYRNSQTARRHFAEAMADTVFVTFNYDRLLERTLWEHLVTGLGLDDSEASDMLATIPILHVYGSIGQLPEIGGKQPYGLEAGYLRDSASRIRTFTETVDGMVGDAVAAQIAAADTLCFLGFGFHRRNMEVLFPEGVHFESRTNAPRVFATCQGLSQRRRNDLRAEFQSPYSATIFFDGSASGLLEQEHDALFAS